MSLVARGAKHTGEMGHLWASWGWSVIKVSMYTKRYLQLGSCLFPWTVMVRKKSISSTSAIKMWQEPNESFKETASCSNLVLVLNRLTLMPCFWYKLRLRQTGSWMCSSQLPLPWLHCYFGLNYKLMATFPQPLTLIERLCFRVWWLIPMCQS